MKYRIEIKWGLYFVLMTLVWMLGERLAGLHDKNIAYHPIFTNFIALPAIALYFFALRDKRIHFYGGKMTYLQGFVSGMIITLVVALLSPITQYITSVWITPHYFENVIAYVVDQKKMTLEAAQENFNLTFYMIQATVGAVFMGTVTAAVVALFSKGKA